LIVPALCTAFYTVQEYLDISGLNLLERRRRRKRKTTLSILPQYLVDGRVAFRLKGDANFAGVGCPRSRVQQFFGLKFRRL